MARFTHDLVVVHRRIKRCGEQTEERGENRSAAMLDRDPDREQAYGAGADHRVGDEPGMRVADPAKMVTPQAHHLAGDQQIHDLADDVDREEQRGEPDIEERRRSAAPWTGRCPALPGERKDSIRVVTQILQQPFGSGGRRLDVPARAGPSSAYLGCALIAVVVPVSVCLRMGRRAGKISVTPAVPTQAGPGGRPGPTAGGRSRTPAINPALTIAREVWSKFDEIDGAFRTNGPLALVLLGHGRRKSSCAHWVKQHVSSVSSTFCCPRSA
jgi:hypothetical protein